ncbi:alginate O-acetyltransferase complex protein AlgJ [Burkholderia sp. GAS332]|uniref:alginate O-acetyltransferase AlgX-related protein n=1 Tax=Paraburkholderia sediminicola TaxID=458836 RepID=UPI00092C6CC7|nr:alginate O-acetyltransferase complex protein AlgJ [Burkholderia sp. GAS332]
MGNASNLNESSGAAAAATARSAPHQAAGSPDAQPPGHRALAACFAMLLAAGLTFGALSLAGMLRDWRAPPAHAWLDGTAEATLSRALKLPYDSTLRTFDASWRYRLLGDLGPQVTQGCPGWLFYRDGLQASAQAEDAYAARLHLLGYYAQAVHSRGAQLLVVTVPDKARIESAALCGVTQDKTLQARLDRWQGALAAANLAHVDLRVPLSAVRPAAFYRTDVHWNERGAEAAAAPVAAAALALLGEHGKQTFSTTVAGSPQPRLGDLIVLAGLEHAPDAWRPAPDLYVPVTLRPVHSGGLLDDTPPAEVMMVGSSFSRRSNFTERVGEKLGREIWNRSVDGGQFSNALQSALDDREPWPASLHLVIWELSEQALSSPLSDAERQALTKFDALHRSVPPVAAEESVLLPATPFRNHHG